ncbi:unnamed protein product [Caenorhabditis bovis]|uniref:hydroxyacylglutathione hydrolase n=1 Tax=Caenorhabditis bovis TaxID=2654633 RepID=A0A8S1ERL8_9PELO|nr:unnamed protein product [Caenorhabditis bovis]
MLRLASKRTQFRMVHVDVIKALEDNYMYAFRNNENDTRILVVDPVEPKKLEQFAAERKLNIQGALVTHHHWDHAGGTPEFRKIHPDANAVPIFGGDTRIENVSTLVKHNEVYDVAGMKIKCLSTPCHTSGHICYHVTSDDGHGVVFTGDTLFIAGCGKFFEGTAPEMHRNLNDVLAKLPDETKVYPGHEYTLSNLKFAKECEPNNKDIEQKLAWSAEKKAKKEVTVPSTIGEEKRINPFMRVAASEEIRKFIGTEDMIEGMKRLREAKNNFRADI